MASATQVAAAAFGAGFLAHKLVTSIFFPPATTSTTHAAPTSVANRSPPKHTQGDEVSVMTPPDSPSQRRLSSAPGSQGEMEVSSPAMARLSFMSASGTPESDSSFGAAERLTGVQAAAQAALRLSDAIFSYETGDAAMLSETVASFLSAGELNCHGRSPTYHEVSTRSGAGRIVVGASSAGITNVAVFVPSMSLPLMLPAIKQLRKAGVPAVLHVLAQSITEQLSFHADLSGVLLVRDVGAAITASYTVQECFNLALVAHIVAVRTATPVIHTFDGTQIARASAVVSKIDFSNDFIDDAMNRNDVTNRNSGSDASATVAQVFDDTFSHLAPVFKKRYSLFETPRPNQSSCKVLVVLGPGAAALCRTAAHKGIHVIVVRVYRPWSASHFVAALPRGVKEGGRSWSIGIATVAGRASVLDALSADVIATLNNTVHWKGSTPTVVKFNIEPSATGVTQGMAAHVADKLLSTLGNATLSISDRGMPAAVHDERNATHAAGGGHTISIWGTAGVVPVSAVITEIEAAAHSVHALHMHSLIESDHLHPLTPTHGRVLLDQHSADDDQGHSITSTNFDVVVVTDAALLTSHTHDISCELSASGRSTLVVALSPPFETAAHLIDSFPDALKSALVSTKSRIIIVGDDNVVTVTVTVTPEALAHQALLAALSPATSTIKSHVAPAAWRSIKPLHNSDADATSQQAKFTRRLSTVNFSSTTASTPSPTKAQIVDSHRLSWDYIFTHSATSDKVVKEVLRPDEHGELFRVKCTKNQRLTPAKYDRNVFHLEFDTTGTGLTYNIGDALGVFGHNDTSEVEAFIQAYGGLNASDFVSLPRTSGDAELLTVTQLLKTRLDLFGKPSQKFYDGLSKFATDSYEHKKLAWTGSEDKESYRLRQLETTTYADVLIEFKSARPCITDLVDLIPTIKPRHYSIASSSKMCPNSVHLLVVAVEWVTPQGRTRSGQCTRYLAGLNPDDTDQYVTVDIKPSVCHLPSDPMTPVVCAGLGTGLAPFRAFVQERMYLKSQGVAVGPMSMYFGARFRSQEYLYEDDLEAAAKAGVITDLRLAFSRDQGSKVYIQDLIREDKHKLAGYFKNDGGFFYLCGPTWPVPDVRAAIHNGLQEATAMSEQVADEFLEEMKENGRYILEVY